ncbi:MAG TPA: ABC transporter ATP-binding protein [Syntrophomonadaceae bacterium]|nr:ABC transporter ATP-binding protein [Syntrophomonadaceae bacterium]HOQ09707.1 ABC transporter ATP-binding protein [Syntrophomonadaceae bacterium]HPU48506.1 ABC transporter ATP-binding protein [Syntrophomonadaceae bacterium]
MGNLIVITNLAKSFDDKKVLDNINLSICKSERAALIGPSGSGKTTLLRIISGLETPSQGTVQIHTRNIGYVFQEPRLIPWRTVEQNLLFVNPDAELEDILAKLRLKDFKNHYPHQLSGGMKQRVNLARALITNPDLLILDEPFSSLDLPIKLEIINDVLLQWQERKFTMILVTHDLKEALLLADRIIILSSSPGRIIKDLTVDLNPVNRKISDPALLSIESDILHVLSSAY